MGKEKSIEQKLARATKGGRMGFVEVKAPGERPRPLQAVRHRLLRKLGFKVYVLDRGEDIPRILDGIGDKNGNSDNAAGRQE